MTTAAATRDAPLADRSVGDAPVRRIAIAARPAAERRRALDYEWLVTNGLGGYASGTIGGAPTRRYHGLLVAALPPPHGRQLVLSEVIEHLELPEGRSVPLADEGHQHGGCLAEFRLELGLPVWRFEVADVVLEKRIVVPQAQNSVHLLYRLLGGATAALLKLEIVPHNRPHGAPVSTPVQGPVTLDRHDDGRYELAMQGLPRLRLRVRARRATFVDAPGELPQRRYAVEEANGNRQCAIPWTPGYFRLEVAALEPAALVASTEPWPILSALRPQDALAVEQTRRRGRIADAAPVSRRGLGAELVLAADQFVVTAVARTGEACGDAHERTVIAGYHCLTDWGRDALIGLEGLTLVTGRAAEARRILRTFARAIRDGLLPNLYPEGAKEGLYHSADTALWLFHAVDRYVTATGDGELLGELLPCLVDAAERHVAGTRFGIGVDPDDGLLEQGADGYQLTWMNTKIDDWVVTPRRGKTVEINALWYNALRLLADWLRCAGRAADAEPWAQHAARARESFNRRFFNPATGFLYDLVDGDFGPDPSCRPNQVLALSLRHPVLDRRYWRPVLDAVREQLLTPLGLRSLAPGHHDYRPTCEWDGHRPDSAAYHQGTVWPWLLGPFVDAWLRAYPSDVETARGFLDALEGHLSEGCIGSISQIVDAEPPHAPRGCISQAWSVAEVLRSWVKVRTHRAVPAEDCAAAPADYRELLERDGRRGPAPVRDGGSATPTQSPQGKVSGVSS